MYQFKDLTGLTRAAVGILWVYMISQVLVDLANFYAEVISSQPPSDGTVALEGLLALIYLPTLILSFIIVGCWIYRANANAHAIGGDLTVTPGWAVGWYFVPVANLFKPFQAMKETWLASHYGGGWGTGTATGLLNWWWGLWIVSNILANLSWRISTAAPQPGAWIGLIGSIIAVPLSLILITIITQISEAQKAIRHAEVFA
jgi:hypothetical protein